MRAWNKVPYRGDPGKFEINGFGELLVFTPDGYVLDHQGQVAGIMVCHISH
jgi:hypothetical protein